MDLTDPRLIGWWTITCWTPNNVGAEDHQFPDDGFLKGGPLLIVKAEEGCSLFWPDKKQRLCSLDYSADAQSWVTFAENDGFLCLIEDSKVEELNPLDPRALKLTVTLTTDSGKSGGASGNTGTFIAQAPPGGW